MAANVLCVTRDQKFKETAKRIDISENQLEEILHKYFNDPAVSDKKTYPSDEVILSKVQGETFFGDENQIALWNQRYSQPIQAANVQELNALKEYLEQFFPPESIGVKEKQNGTFEVSVKKPLREHDFLWRGVGSKPRITSNGDLVLTPYIDSLWGSYGLSFATNREEAENYGRRSSKNPFIIRVSKEFLEKLYPFNPEGGTQSVGQRVIGDEYGGVEREERVVMDAKDSIIVPKEFYSIDRNPILLNTNPARAAEEVLHAEAMYNVGDELPFSSTYNKFSSQDIQDYWEALVSLVGSEEEAYYYMAEAAMNNTSDASAAGRSYLELMEKTTPERRQELEDRITEFYNATGMYPEGEHVNLLGSRRDVRLDELIKKENVSVVDLLSLIDSSSEYSGILELIRTQGKRVLDGVQVKLIEGNQSSLFDKSRAFYSAKDKTIFINTLSNYRGGRADSVIMHEVMHAITVNRILGNRAFRAEFDKIIGEYQKHFYNQRYSKTGLNKEMASHYMEEFIADVWSNIDTINNLKSIKTNTKQTLWDKIKNFFTKIFKGSDNTLMARASDTLYRLLDQPELVSASDNYREGETLEVSTAGDEFGKQLSTTQSPQRQVIESIRPSLQRDFIKATQRNKQVDAMLSSEVITPTDISDAALVVSHWVSDMLTSYQTNPELVFDNFTNISRKNDWSTEQDKKDDLDRVSKMSRKEIVELIGPNNLLERAKETIFKSEEIGGETGDVDAMVQADFFYDNFNGLLLYASPLISSSEDFVLKSIDDEGFESNVATVKEDDIFGDENVPQDRDTLNEVTRDMTEHWAVESRTLDVWKTATQQVRNALMQCYLLVEDTDSDGKVKRDENGNKLYKRVVNKFAQEEHVRALDATHQILNWVQGSINSQDMIAKLQDKVDDNPWITQIIDRLKDTSGKEADFRSQFFKTFYKYWQSYYVQLKNKKTSKVHTSPVNATPALNQVMDEIKAQYTIGAVPLFTSYGINTEAFDKLSKYADNLKKGKETKTIDKVLGDEDKTTKLATAFANVATLLGYPVKVEDMGRTLTADTFNSMTDALVNIRDILQRNLGVREYNPFKWGKDSITGYVRTFLTPTTVGLQDIQQGTFYANGKMYQGHVTPSYTTKMMDKLSGSQEVFEQFLMDEFANTEWFVTEVGLPIETLRTRVSVWRNLTLQRLVGLSEEERQRFTGHKVVLNYLGNREYMRNMTSSEYAMSVLTEFASEQGKSEETAIPAWYIFPMESNKPSEEFFKSFRFVGDTYKDTILRGMKMIFDQEISRIQTVMMRNLKEGDAWYIENFDGKNGRRFNFLPWMNKYLEGGELADSEAGKELQRKLRGDEKELKENPINEKLISDTVRNETRDYLKERVRSTIQRFKDTGIYNSLKTIENVGSTETEINNFLENFIWNHIYAENSFLEMTVTDLAYYKHSEDLQKRLAQLHSPGLVGDRFATDYNGNSVTDGYFRTIHIEDLERKDGKGVAANVVDNLRAYFEQRIEQLPEASREPYRAFAENFMSNYDNFTVTDGQAFSVLTSLRKKSFVFGNWSREMETIWEKFRDGKFNVTDINTVSQVKKPFTYSQINKPSNAEGAPIQTLKYGVQYKDSEALLMMAFGIIGDTDTGRPNILRAIMKVMEETHYALNDKGEWTVTDNGIDTAVFHSTVKTGYSTGINLNDLLEDPDGEAKAIERLRTAIGHFGKEYNEAYVNKIRVEDASQQLEVPGHFRDHDNIWGSQERYIIPSAVETTFMGQDVTYDVEGRKLSASEFKAEYEETTSQNIEDSLTSLAEELGLDQYEISKEDRNVALSQVLQKEILESPRYGSDLLLACSVDENTGEFRIPLGDPVQSKRVEQLINSVVKNRINKQKFKGGPSVLVTNWGSTRRLHIVFRGKDGDLLPVRSDWEKGNPRGNYDEFLKENQASPAWYECFASATTVELFRDFMDRDGFIDIESIEMLENGEELLKMIGYRIPTEDMYSIAPFRIVGFLPKEMGDAFMQPWEMPAITGEDHDVDKKNLLRKEIHIEKTKDYQDENGKENRKKLKAAILKELPEFQTLNGDRLVSEFLSGDRRGKAITDEMKKIKKVYLNLMFKVVEPGVQITDSGVVADGETRMDKRDARNNHVFNMTWGLLTHPASTEKILNTGSFEPQKNLGYKVTAMKANPNMSWEEINRMSTDEAKDIAFNRKYLPDFTTQMEYYENNSVAGNVLGQAAVQRIAHAILQGGNYGIVMPGDYQFTLAGQEFKGFVPIDNEYAYSKAAVSLTNDAVEVAKITQESIGKTLGNHVGAAADAVKDPVLNLLNINTSTFRTYATMLRLGVPFEVAGLMLSSKAMDDVLAEHKKRSLVKYVPLAQVIDKALTSIEKTYGLKDTTAKTEELTYDELIDGLRTTGDIIEDNRIAYKILTHWRDFEAMASASQPLTVATRYNSVASAVGPQVVDNLIQEHKANTANTRESSYVLCKSYTDSSGETQAYPVGTQDVLNEHPILNSFSKAYLKASDLLRDMPAQSRGFEDVRKLIPESLQETFYNDRGILLDLSDFYQSYLLVKNGVVNPANLEYFVDVFPKEFLQKGYKEKYAGNPFVDAIKPDTRGNKDGEEKLVLKIDTSGMKQSDIDRIKLGWAQLHKENPNLSRMLFEYNFAIAGIGYSPKTFMNCLPTQVKEAIPGYVDTYRHFPELTVPDAERIVEQFILNNVDEGKLVPYISKLDEKVVVNKEGLRTFTTNKENSDYAGLEYFKTSTSDGDVVYKLTFTERLFGKPIAWTYEQVLPLGDNGSYLEISTSDINRPLRSTTALNTLSPRGEENGVQDSTTAPQRERITDSDRERNIRELRQILQTPQGPVADERLYSRIRRGEITTKAADEFARGLADRLRKKGVPVNENTILEIKKRLC